MTTVDTHTHTQANSVVKETARKRRVQTTGQPHHGETRARAKK